MKKLLTIALLLAFTVSSAFAGATTITKLNSQANYPGVLVPGSLIGANTFIQDVALMTNTAIFEYLGDPVGVIALKTDMGVIGVSVSPIQSFNLGGIDPIWAIDNMLGLQYVMGLDGMTLGLGINYGVDSDSWENKEITTNAQNPDKTSDFEQVLGLKVGAALKGDLGLDVGLSINLLNEYEVQTDFDNASEAQEWKDIEDNSLININLAARMALGKDMKAVVSADFTTGQEKYTYVSDTDNNGTNENDYDNIYTNSAIAVSALVGKDIKASETLKIKLAAGLGMNTSSNTLYKVVDRVADTTTYPTNTSYGEVSYNVPFNVAVEGKLNDTWSVNAGVGTALVYGYNYGNKDKTDATSDKYEDYEVGGSIGVNPDLDFAIGLTGKIGDLTLDLHLNPYILIAGPYFITGTNSGNLNASIALSYNWK